MRKKLIALLLLCCLAVPLAACGGKSPAGSDTRTVVDTLGRSVEVPAEPKAVATLSPFAGPMVVLYGWGDRMPATSNAVKRDLLIHAMEPALENSVSVKSSGSMNAEEILRLNVDLIFVDPEIYHNPDERAKLEALDIPYVVIAFTDMAGQMAAARVIGEALGETEEAEAYVAWYQEAIDRVAGGVADIPGDELPRLYHSVNEAVRTDYPGSVPADWIAVTRAINVSLDAELEMKGDHAYTTLEQIYVWDPDVIIANEPGVDDYILTDEKWAGLRAVRDGRVYQIPVGVTRWGHPNSVETPLAILWLAELLYPDRFDIDIVAEMKHFYKTFFDYDMDDATARAVLQGDGIRTPKKNRPDK